MKKTNEIGFYRCARSTNFIVTWTVPNVPPQSRHARQQIVVLPGAFYRILPHVDRRSTAGCTYITDEQLTELGFVKPYVIDVIDMRNGDVMDTVVIRRAANA